MFLSILKNTVLITGIAIVAVIIVIYILILYVFVNVSSVAGASYGESLRRFAKYIWNHLLEIVVFLGIMVTVSYLISQYLS